MKPTEERERELVTRWRNGDTQAGRELVEAYERILFVGVSHYVRSTPTSVEDLAQIVRTELLEAFRKSDPVGEYRPSTYAMKYAFGATINQCSRDSTIAVKYRARRRAREHERSGKDLPDYLRLQICLRETASLDEPLPASDGAAAVTLLDLLPGDLPLPDERLVHTDALAARRATIDAALSKLSDRERQAVSMYLMTEDEPTLQEVAAAMGISHQAVHQNLVKALPKLRKAIALALGPDAPRTQPDAAAPKKAPPLRPTGESQSGALLRALLRVGSAPVKELVAATHGQVPDQTVYGLLRRMLAAGLVAQSTSRNGVGRLVTFYGLTDAGRAEATRLSDAQHPEAA